jgi:hypothetical protein
LPRAEDVRVFPALQGANGPVGGTRWVGLVDGVADGLAVALGEGLVVSEGLGVGAATAGPEKNETDRDVTAMSAVEILRYVVTA